MANPTVSSATAPQTTISNDAVTIAENAMRQSGGDARAAFYALAKQKGIDGDQFLNQIRSMGNPQSMLQNMVTSNPRIGRLMSLFSGLR